MEAVNNPEDASMGTRKVPFSRVLYIEQDDFRENPPKQFYRLSPGREVRLRYGYFITCTSVVKDEKGEVIGDPLHLRSGHPRRQCSGRTQGEIDDSLGLGGACRGCRGAPVRQPVHAWRIPIRRMKARDFTANLNPNSLEVLTGCKLEPSLRDAAAGSRYQFERLGYFCVDPDTTAGQAGV